MDLCAVQPEQLHATWKTGIFSALPASVGAVLSLWGYGLLVERLIRRASGLRRAPMDWAYALVQGVVVTSLLLFAASLLNWVRVAWPVFAGGIVSGGLALALGPKRLTPVWPGWSSLSLGKKWALAVLAAAALGLLTGPIFLSPAHLSDLTAIWMFKAKALSCDGVLTTYLNRETVWTGTHPEYPLLYPLIQSYVFRLAETFRDDITKLWVWAVWLAAAWKWGTWCFENLRSRWVRGLGVLWILILVTHLGWDAKPELIVAALAGLVAVAWLERDYARLPLLLFGMAFTKQDGLAIAAVFVAVAAWMWWPARRSFTREETARLKWGGFVFLALCASWIGVQKQLPDLHEQYGQRLLSREAWATGLSHWGQVLWQNGVRLFRWPWVAVFPFVIFGTPFWIVRSRHSAVAGLFLWVAGCFWFFHVVHIITPWGPDLSFLTMFRILTEFYLPLALGFCLWLDGAVASAKGWERVAVVLILGFHVLHLGVAAIQKGFENVPFLKAQFEVASEAAPSPGWPPLWSGDRWRRQAVALDTKLGVMDRGATLDDYMFFHANYLLFPRRLYPALPDQLVGTWRPWTPWSKAEDVDVARGQFQFIVNGPDVVWRAPAP